MLNVLMVATSYPQGEADWQGRFIVDMAGSVARGGDRCASVSLWAPPGQLPSQVSSALRDEDAVWLNSLRERGGIVHLLRQNWISGAWAAFGLLFRLRSIYRTFGIQERQTVAHVNWIQNALPLTGTRIPALISVLGSDFGLLRLPGMVWLVRRMLAERKAILAPNAEWMVPALQHHFGDLAEVRPFPFGIHERWFSVERLPEAPTSGDWIVVSRLTRDKLGALFEWGGGLFCGERRLHLFGPMQENLNLPDWVNYHGPTNPMTLAKDWFPRVAGLVTLSTHDEGRPQVMLEAMAAGLPVIASELPAHRDLLQSGEAGCLVSERGDLSEALTRLSCRDENLRIGRNGRQWAKERIGSWQDYADRCLDAYQELVSRDQ